jgi:hypothetical protein
MTDTLPAATSERKHLAVVEFQPVSPEFLQQQVNMIQACMKQVMKDGTHFGIPPGCDKPCLYKAGAEKIALMFRLRTRIQVLRNDLDTAHREYTVTCEVFDMNDFLVGQGIGSCSTMESKYRWRQGQRKCPTCGKETILKSKGKDGRPPNWFCWEKKGGCGANFRIDDPEITDQIVGKVPNPDIADQYNTVLKMAKKRAFVDAILTCTAASDVFTQDVEDVDIEYVDEEKDDRIEAIKREQAEREKKEAAEKAAKAIHYYDLKEMPDASLEPAKSYLQKAGADFDMERGVWVSKRDLPKLQKYEVRFEEEAVNG